jgi:uncharacterized protein (TIGR03435 family)
VSDDLAARPQAELFSVLPLLLQSLLEDRFKLKVHRETRELPVYVLSTANRNGSLGPQLRPSAVNCAAEPDKCTLRPFPGHLSGVSNLEIMTNLLAVSVERVVVDHTGLAGQFEYNLEWSPDQSASDKPSLFAAIQEQLGLKLESTKGPVDVLVIDHVEKPTPD